MKRTTSNIFNSNLFSSIFFFFWGLLSCFSFQFFVSLFLLFLDFKLCFLFNMSVFGFKTNNLKTHTFLVKKRVATKRFFFMSVCFAKCQKLSFLGFFFFSWANFG